MTSSHETLTGWVLMQRRASINAAAHVNVLVHNTVGNVARHMAARRFAWHINPKSGCWPIANNKRSYAPIDDERTSEPASGYESTSSMSIKIRNNGTQIKRKFLIGFVGSIVTTLLHEMSLILNVKNDSVLHFIQTNQSFIDQDKIGISLRFYMDRP